MDTKTRNSMRLDGKILHALKVHAAIQKTTLSALIRQELQKILEDPMVLGEMINHLARVNTNATEPDYVTSGISMSPTILNQLEALSSATLVGKDTIIRICALSILMRSNGA